MAHGLRRPHPGGRAHSDYRITYRGAVTDIRRPIALYDGCDCIVCPSHAEGMLVVLIEAMARGVAVIATDVGASRELVDDSNGQIIPKRDPGALADALLKLDRIGPAGRAALGTAGRERALLRFTWQRVAKAHVDLFAQVAASMP